MISLLFVGYYSLSINSLKFETHSEHVLITSDNAGSFQRTLKFFKPLRLTEAGKLLTCSKESHFQKRQAPSSERDHARWIACHHSPSPQYLAFLWVLKVEVETIWGPLFHLNIHLYFYFSNKELSLEKIFLLVFNQENQKHWYQSYTACASISSLTFFYFSKQQKCALKEKELCPQLLQF